MHLTPYDEYPVHQAAHPFSYVPSTDYNWDDGYYFGVFSPDDGVFLATGARLNPNSDLFGGYALLNVRGHQTTLRFNRVWRPDFSLKIGPWSVEFVEPLKSLRLVLEKNESGIEFDATLVFMCWAGEEQGLIGSMAHAQKLAADKVVVEANFNNDIIGNSVGGNGQVDAKTVRIYSLGPEDNMSRSLARYIERIAAVYVPSHRIRLMAREDRFGRGSDHSSFTANSFPAVVFREANENFNRQHNANDLLEGVDFRYLAQNVRVNAASAASLALAPQAPVVTDQRGSPRLSRNPSGYDANLQWTAVSGAVAYRIYWRDSWSNSWEHAQTVGNVTQFVLPGVSIDDWVFGVAAVGADGHESLVSAYVSQTRRMNEVKLVIKP